MEGNTVDLLRNSSTIVGGDNPSWYDWVTTYKLQGKGKEGAKCCKEGENTSPSPSLNKVPLLFKGVASLHTVYASHIQLENC